MRGSIQILESRTKGDESKSNLMEIILRESDRLNEIITNFLKYARPKASKFSDFDVRQPIEDTMTLLRHSPDVRDSHVLVSDLPDEPIVISADASQLKQIFWNLSRNAIQSMKEGGTLRVSLSQAGPNRITITFSDTGCGMSPKQVEQLFEPFSKSTTGGTGLGLSIVYQIVRDHSGTINVTSKENEGTDIKVHLPTDYGRNQPDDGLGQESAEHSHLGEYLNVKQSESTISS